MPGAKAGAILRHQGGSCLGTPADHAGHQGPGGAGRRHRGTGRHAGPAFRAGPRPEHRDRWRPGRGVGPRPPAVGRTAGGRLAVPGRVARVVRPHAGHAAGQSGRDRVLDRGAGAGRRAGRRPVRLDPVPGRLPAADHAGVLVHQQPRHRLPRRADDQRGDQRRHHAAGLPGLPQARARPPGRVRRGHGRRAGARRVLLQPVRDDRRGLPGDHPGLAAGHAQLADRVLRPGPVRGGGRFGAAGRVRLHGPLAGAGAAGRLRRGRGVHGLAPDPPPAAAWPRPP